MTALDLVIQGGTLVTAAGAIEADLGVRDGRIAAIGAGLGPAAETLDAHHLLVLPGGVDSHCHIDQAGAGDSDNADDFASGTASAAAGGTTTLVCFARQSHGQSLAAATADYTARVVAGTRVDVALHLLITDPTPDVLERELPALVAAGHRSVKVFMTYPDQRLNDRQLMAVLAAARACDTLVAVHAEDDTMVTWLTAALLRGGHRAPRFHAASRPPVVERSAIDRVVALAALADQPIQIFHVSGELALAGITAGRAAGHRLWGETCTHYLTLTEADLDRPGEGGKFVCSPALRTAADHAALWRGLRDGTLANVTSDHSPLRWAGARGKQGVGGDLSFDRIPNGLPGVAARLPLVFSEGVVAGRIDLATFAAITAGNAAMLYGLWPVKGGLHPGADADLVLYDPKRRVALSNPLMQHGSDYTPYEGMHVTGWPAATFVRGQAVMRDGAILAAPGTGRLLLRQPYQLPA